MNWRFFDLEHLSASLVIGALVLTLFLTNFGHVNALAGTPTPTLSPYGCEVEDSPFIDSDGDGLKNSFELAGFGDNKVKTNPCEKDTDDDGLTDREELLGNGPQPPPGQPSPLTTDNQILIDGWKTDPTNPDHDGDGVRDGDEFSQYSVALHGGHGGMRTELLISNPTKADTDDDGLDDKREREGWTIIVNGLEREVRSSTQTPDTDSDGLTDKEEHDGLPFPRSPWATVKTDPARNDTDGDGIHDEDEYQGAGKPGKNILLDPTSDDTDGDRLKDKIELESVLCHPARADTDGDGRSDYLSKNLECGIEDRDGDGLPDRIEIGLGLDPNLHDTDGDGLSDWKEIEGSTHPNKADTDGDGEGDKTDKDPNATDDKSKDLKALNEGLNATLGERDQTIKDNQKRIYELTSQNESLPVPKDNGNLKATASPSAKADAPVKQDTGSESNILMDWMYVFIAAVVALILGAGIGYFIMNRPAAPDYRLRQEAEDNARNDSGLKRQMAREAADEAREDPALREEIRNEIIRDSGDGLQEKREVVRARLNNTRTELRGAVAATNRGIPDAMLQEAEDRISSTSGDNNTQAEDIEVASSLIRNVDRYYLGHNPAT
jgi:hypothetical protein